MKKAGCLKKRAINTGHLHLHTKGLFCVAKDNKVGSFTLRFFPSQRCVRDIKSILQCSVFSTHGSKKRT